MNGPQHAEEAERLRGAARDCMNQGKWKAAAYFNDAALVHATLAQTAALLDTSNLNKHPVNWNRAFKDSE